MRRGLPLALVAAFALLPASWLESAPRITIKEQQVIVTGVTPGAAVAWIGVSCEEPRWVLQRFVWNRVTVDEDNDGMVVLDIGRDASPVSLWAAVDVATGESAVEYGEAVEPRPVAFPANRIGPKPADGDWFSDARKRVEMVVVRAGVGAWHLSAGDGAQGDSDGRPDGVLRPALAAMTGALSTAPVFAGFDAGDIVLAVDPGRLEYYTGVVNLEGSR